AEEVARDDDIKGLRRGHEPRGERVDEIARAAHVGEILRHTVDDLVPQDARVLLRVRLRSRRDLLAPRSRALERVARDALDAATRVDSRLERDLIGSAAVREASDTGVLALGVLAHAEHVDGRGRAVPKRRGDPVEHADRSEVHVQVEGLAHRKEQAPEAYVIRDTRETDR